MVLWTEALSGTQTWTQTKPNQLSTPQRRKVLLLNSTEVIVFGRKRLGDYLITLDGIALTSSTTVKHLGVIFDEDSHTV